MTEDILESGLCAMREGNLALARTLLASAVRQNPTSARAWFWLGRVVDKPDRKKFCFQRALQLDPSVFETETDRPLQPAPGSSEKISPPVPLFAPEEPPLNLPQVPIQSVDAHSTSNSPVQVLSSQSEPAVETPSGTAVEPRAGRPRHHPPAQKKGRAKIQPLPVILLGVLAGCILIGVPAVLLVLSGRLDGLFNDTMGVSAALAGQSQPISFTATPLPSLPPLYTATTAYTPTTAPSRTPTLTPDAQHRMQSIQAQARMASDKMKQKLYEQAIPLWDKVINAAPDYAEAYFQRGMAYYMMTGNLRIQSEYEDYLKLALADFDKAIAIGPATGDYFFRRGQVYNDWAGITPYRVDNQPLLEASLENKIIGVNNGTTVEWADRDIPEMLISLGRCNEGLAETQRLLAARSPSDPPSAGLNWIMATSYLCLGEYDKALTHMDIAFKLYQYCDYYTTKTEILYGLGRLDEANKLISECIDRSPSFGGYRYYLRALIEYDQGNRDKAREDLEIGAGNTWYHEGLYAYMMGRLALDDGNKEEAIAMFQLAEATIGLGNSAKILNRIRSELAAVGSEPISPTQSIFVRATPISPDRLTIVPQTTTTPTATPTQVSAIDGSELPIGYLDAVQVDFATGTGPMTFKAGELPLFHFHPAKDIPVKRAKKIIVYLEAPADQASPYKEPFYVSLFTRDGGWRFISPTWGENVIEWPSFYIGKNGDLYVGIQNTTPDTISVNNIGFLVTVERTDGVEQTYGLDLAGK